MFRGILNWAYHMILLYLLFKVQQETTWLNGFFKESNSPTWFDGKLKDYIILGIVTFLTSMMNILINNFHLPLTLIVTQNNNSTRTTRTTYARYETGIKNRTISCKITVKRCVGLNSILRYYLKKYKIYILIACNSVDLELQACDEFQKSDEIIPTDCGKGFYINITKYLNSIAAHNNNAEPFKTHPYFIRDSREFKTYINANTTCYINPELKVDGFKDAPRLLKFVLGWNPQQHEIEYNVEGV